MNKINNEIKEVEYNYNRTKFKFSFWETLRFQIPFWHSPRMRLFKEVLKRFLIFQAISFVKNKLDIRNVIINMMEMEKFKQLLFDEHQYCVFEHLPKPLLYDRYMYKKGKSSSNHKVSVRLSHMEAFWRTKPSRIHTSLWYDDAIEQMKEKTKLDVIDQRLLELVGA